MNDDITNKFSKEVKIKHYKDEIKRLAILQGKLESELTELIGKDGEIGIREEKMKMEKQRLSIWQRLGIILMAVLTACIGIGIVIGGFVYYITTMNKENKIDLPEYTEKTEEINNGEVESDKEDTDKQDEKIDEDNETPIEIDKKDTEEEKKCLFRNTYYDKPENSHCILDNPKNAWECDEGYEEDDNTCVEIEEPEDEEDTEDSDVISEEIALKEEISDDKCLFNDEYKDKPENARCIDSIYHAWKCNSGFVEVSDDCIAESDVDPTEIADKCLFLGRYYSKPENAHCTPDDNTNAWECDSAFEEVEGYKCILEE